jgi:hypothetical protein
LLTYPLWSLLHTSYITAHTARIVQNKNKK